MNNNVEGLMGVSVEKIREMVDANTIVGTPITVGEGVTLIPISKVTYGFASGGSTPVVEEPASETPAATWDSDNPLASFSAGASAPAVEEPVVEEPVVEEPAVEEPPVEETPAEGDSIRRRGSEMDCHRSDR